jgi:hypothetical protein
MWLLIQERLGRHSLYGLDRIGAGEGIRTPDPNLGKVLLGLTGAIRAHPTPLHTIGFPCVS